MVMSTSPAGMPAIVAANQKKVSYPSKMIIPMKDFNFSMFLLWREQEEKAKVKKLGVEIGKDAAEKSKGLFSADDWMCTK